MATSKGAGSRGGNIIGHTKSGAPIYSPGHNIYTKHGSIGSGEGTAGRAIQKYSADDHRNASDFHSDKAKESLEKYKKTNASDPKAAQGHLNDMQLHSKASGQHNAGIQWAETREKNKVAVAEQDKKRDPKEMHYRNMEAKDKASHEAKAKIQSKVARHRAKMAKSIDCPECAEPITQDYAIKGLANLAKSQGCDLPDSMATLVKGDGVSSINCPSCFASMSQEYVVKSVSMAARKGGQDIQAGLEAIFKSKGGGKLGAKKPASKPEMAKSDAGQDLFPCRSMEQGNAFILGTMYDKGLANHIKQNGFIAQQSQPVHQTAPRSLMEKINAAVETGNEADPADYQN